MFTVYVSAVVLVLVILHQSMQVSCPLPLESTCMLDVYTYAAVHVLAPFVQRYATVLSVTAAGVHVCLLFARCCACTNNFILRSTYPVSINPAGECVVSV